MNLFSGLDTLIEPFARSTIAIGTFDGIHVGHQAIIRQAVENARENCRPCLVFTFDRHPLEILAPQHAPACLTTPEQRNKLIASLGVDSLVVARFDAALSQLAPDAFLRDILKGRLGAEAIVVGSNFFFGKDRGGSAEFLADVQTKYEFELIALEPVIVDGLPASSTRIRESLRNGDIGGAEQVLGHPYWLAGEVVGGQRLGRELGYPTANLKLAYRQVVPADGIYAVLTKLEGGREIGGACSIGNRPTVEGAGRAIETYLLDFNEDLYGMEMEIRFIKRLREELKFDSLDALKSQMAQDVIDAKLVLKYLPG